jgi:hypothetical protein
LSNQRRNVFRELVLVTKKELLSGTDATDPLKRNLVDIFLGALNRREILDQQYLKLIDQFNKGSDSLVGGFTSLSDKLGA